MVQDIWRHESAKNIMPASSKAPAPCFFGSFMKVSLRRHGNILILSPDGRIDHAHADAFKAALDNHLGECKSGDTRIILDFADVSYMSSVGLRMLMLAARQVKAQGGRIVIAALQPLVDEVFKISRFNLVYQVFHSVDAALAELGSSI